MTLLHRSIIYCALLTLSTFVLAQNDTEPTEGCVLGLSLLQRPRDLDLDVKDNGTVSLWDTVPAGDDTPQYTNFQHIFRLDSSGALSSANGTNSTAPTGDCGFVDLVSDSLYLQCSTQQSRTDDYDYTFGVERMNGSNSQYLTYRGNRTFFLCDSIQVGFARDDVPATQIILPGLIDDELVYQSVIDACNTTEILAAGCNWQSLSQDDMQVDNGAEGGEADEDAASGSNAALSGRSWFTVLAAVAGWMLL
jgi:hypothetical protein